MNSKINKMKLKLLTLLFLGGVLAANAQFSVKDGDGNVINDGDIIEFGTTTYPDAELAFFVTNEGSENIYSRVEYISQTNAIDPKFEQLCYGVECYFNIEIGSTVPPANMEAVEIEPGETTGMGNHFYSNDMGDDPNENVDFTFTFKLYEDGNSTSEVGETLTLTYRYNPLLSVNDVQQVNLSLISTIVTDQIEMDINEPVQVQLYDYQGRLIKQQKFEVGKHYMNISDLSAQPYLIRFKNEGGAVKTSKIIKR